MSTSRPSVVGAVTVALALLLAACASSGNPSSGPGTRTSAVVPVSSSVAPSASLTPAPRSSSSSALKVKVDEGEDGTTLTVNRGADVIVTLHSTYWQFQQASAPKVLVQAAPVVQGDPPSRAGIPGSGKGLARETYHAQAPGTATITATRTTCGEAMRCTAAQSVYRITVIVR